MSCLDKLPILDIDKKAILDNLKEGRPLSKNYIKKYLIDAVKRELNLRNELRKSYKDIPKITEKELLKNFTNEYDPETVYDASENSLAQKIMKLVKRDMSPSEAANIVYTKLLNFSNEIDYIDMLGNIDKKFMFNTPYLGTILKTAIIKVEQDKVIAKDILTMVNEISDIVGTC